jgi:ribosomal protein L44E
MEHFTKNTKQVSHWCKKCHKYTMHRVDQGRLGPCLEHAASGLSGEQERRQKKLEEERQNPTLWEIFPFH